MHPELIVEVDAPGQTFEEFVLSDSSRLLRSAFLLVGQRAVAEDLVQDVLERMYVKWSRIEEPLAYARQALVHRSTNRWRAGRRRPEVPLDAHDLPVTHDVDTRLAIVDALATLTPGQRAVVVLRYFDDLDVAATAAALGCSPGTVKSQSARALAALRTVLGDELTTKEDS